MRQDARDQVEREQSLGAAPVAVHRKCDSLDEKRKIGQFTPLLELLGSHRSQSLEQLEILRTRVPRRGKHLVVEISRVVALKQTELRHVRRSGSHCRTLSVNICMVRTKESIESISDFVVGGRPLSREPSRRARFQPCYNHWL